MVYRNRILPTGGEQGPQGPPGADGADGSVWHWVTATPDGSLGKVGDWATRTDTGATWQKTGASTWTSRGSLRGPQGVQGVQGPQGATGPQGIQGTQGPTGATGPKGDVGATGPAGTAATVSVGWTTTGAPGTDASVIQSGTPQARTFNFTIPRGDQGPQGPQGLPGDAGVLGGGKKALTGAQSIPNGTWSLIGGVGIVGSSENIVSETVTWRAYELQCRVNSAGWWMVGASLGYGAGGATGGRYLMVETWTGTDPGVGNAANTRIIYQQNNNPGTSAVTFNVSTVVQLAANTNVRLCAYQTSGSALSTSTAFPTELWLTRIL